MPINDGKEDLRILKTEKALNIAMFSLLENRRFKKLTVRDICEEAMISRATFYAHFADKYDLLKGWLIYLKFENTASISSYGILDEIINDFVLENTSIIRNIINDADDETLDILFDTILSTLDLEIEKFEDGKLNPKYAVLSNFYAGGMIYYLKWQTKNKFPAEVPPMNIYLLNVIEKFNEWKIESKIS